MNADDIIEYLKTNELSAKECHEIMDTLCSQKQVLTGDITTKDRLTFEVECDLEYIGKGGYLKEATAIAEKKFKSFLYYGIEGSIDDLITLASKEAINEIQKREAEMQKRKKANAI